MKTPLGECYGHNFIICKQNNVLRFVININNYSIAPLSENYNTNNYNFSSNKVCKFVLSNDSFISVSLKKKFIIW